jgi:hypothetical protein
MINVAFATFEMKETLQFLRDAGKSPADFFNFAALLVTCGLCFGMDMGLGVLVGVFISHVTKIAAWTEKKFFNLNKLYTLIGRLGTQSISSDQ